MWPPAGTWQHEHMARAHVEFVQAQSLDWQASPWPHLAGTDCKLLSRDALTGACSALIRYPAGWQKRGLWHLDAEEEFFVLEGEFTLGAQRYLPDCYALLPPYWTRDGFAVHEPAVLLTFFDSEPQAVAGRDARAADAAQTAVPHLDAFEMRWESAGMDPAYADIGLRWKMLRGSIGDARTTMLVSCPPHLHPPQWRGPQEVHDCVEEMFLLSGDYLSNVGTMREGAYFWRPPGIAHGPYGTRFGNLAVIRTIGAPLVNNWTQQQVAISRNPPR
jgi:hypothetical protein